MHIFLYHKRIHFYVFNFYWYVFTTTEIAAVCRKKDSCSFRDKLKKKTVLGLYIPNCFYLL